MNNTNIISHSIYTFAQMQLDPEQQWEAASCYESCFILFRLWEKLNDASTHNVFRRLLNMAAGL